MPQTECLAEAFLEQSPACHFIVSADGVFDRIYGDASPIFGKPSPELVGRSLAEALDPEVAATWRGRVDRVLKGEIVPIRERHGSGVWYVSLFPLQSDCGLSYAAGMAREITPLSVADQELRYTVLGALRAQEFERHMMAKFLHDSVGQNLTAFGLQLDLIHMDLETTSPETCARIADIQRLLESVMESVREYSYELNPSAVERTGLRAALDRLAGRIGRRFTGALRINVDPSLKLDTAVASAMYHIAQEAVENAVQHSSCSAIEIAVKSTRNGPTLEVRDNGRGFDPGDTLSGSRGLGLLSMEHYAAQAGLELTIISDRGAGTTVRAAMEAPGTDTD